MKKLNKKGFTIVELVIVIAVIAILAAVLIPTFSGVVDKANKSAALQEARNTLTEYVVSLDEKIPSEIDLVIRVNKGTTDYFFAVNDGVLNTESKTTYNDAKTLVKKGSVDYEAGKWVEFGENDKYVVPSK